MADAPIRWVVCLGGQPRAVFDTAADAAQEAESMLRWQEIKRPPESDVSMVPVWVGEEWDK